MASLLVTSESTFASIVSHYETTGPPLAVRLSPQLSSEDLLRLGKASSVEVFRADLMEILLAHPRCPSELVDLALKISPSVNRIAMAAASSPGASMQALRQLRIHPSPMVQGHALLGITGIELPTLNERQMFELCEQHQGDEGVALGIRHLIVRNASTPNSVLKRLADDDADFIAEAASARLSGPAEC